MSDAFTNQVNPRNIITEIETLKKRVRSLEIKPVRAESADSIVGRLGELDYEVADDAGNIRVIITGKSLLADYGVPAYILALDVSANPKFYVDADAGTIWAEDAVLDGTIYAHAGEIGGFSISDTYLKHDDSIDAQSAGISPADYPFYAGALYANRAAAPFRVTTAGALFATGATITGSISATTGAIGGWNIAANTISAGSITLHSGTPAILMGAALAVGTGVGMFLGLAAGDYQFRIGDPAANNLLWNGSTLSANGQWIRQAGLNPSLQNWTTNIVFSSASDTQINWSSGTITLGATGTFYSISAGNTGTMSALTYIYLDIAVSLTVLQITTTYSTAVGDGKILVATAQNATAGASVIAQNGQQPIINGGAQITALSILAGNIAAGAITATKISVTSLSAITATMGSLTIDATLTMNGASGAITIGSTPPSSATVGTGLWIDRNGVYSLSANTQNATLTSAGLTAAGGALVLNTSGITITASTAYVDARAYKFSDGTNIFGKWQAYADGSSRTMQLIMDGVASRDNNYGVWVKTVTGQASNLTLIVGSGGEATFAMVRDSSGVYSIIANSGNGDADFIVRGQSENNLIHTDASTNRVGIGTATPSVVLDVVGAGKFSNSEIVPLDIVNTRAGGFTVGLRSLPSGNSAANDTIDLSFNSQNSSGTQYTGALLRVINVNPTAGSEDSRFDFYTKIAGAAISLRLRIDGNLTPADGMNIVLGTTTGTQIGTSTTQKLAFYGSTPIVRPSAFTQTYATATKTQNNITAANLTDNTGGTADTTLVAISGTYVQAEVRNNFADLAAMVNKLTVDLTNVKQVLNAVIDDGQALGLFG